MTAPTALLTTHTNANTANTSTLQWMKPDERLLRKDGSEEPDYGDEGVDGGGGFEEDCDLRVGEAQAWVSTAI